MEKQTLSRCHRVSPSFEFLESVALMLSELVIGCISIFSLSLFAYFLWRMVIWQSLSPALAGELREIRLTWVGALGGVHPILV